MKRCQNFPTDNHTFSIFPFGKSTATTLTQVHDYCKCNMYHVPIFLLPLFLGPFL